jgi:TIR domain
MTSSQGFWSYVHADDEAEGGRISRLARDVAAQFEMLTGEPLALFLDRDAIKWGEGWQDKIDTTLASVAFFIPVMTPRYFMSAECRRELQFFARQATRLGVKDLVLPLLYVDVPSLHESNTTDDLVGLVQTFQREDWTELRFADVSAEGYRKGVARLATRLVDANRQAEQLFDTQPVVPASTEHLGESGEELPGYLDLIATAEETLPKLNATVVAIGQEMEVIGRLANVAGAEIKRGDDQRQGFAARLRAFQKLARELSEPSERVWSLGNDFASQLHGVDQGFRALIDQGADEVHLNPDSKPAICNFFSTVRSMSASAHAALNSIETMVAAMTPLEKISRDLRPVLRRFRQGLTTVVEAREVSDEWVQLTNASGIECENPSPEPPAP